MCSVWGSWGEGDLRWRVLPLACAAKLAERVDTCVGSGHGPSSTGHVGQPPIAGCGRRPSNGGVSWRWDTTFVCALHCDASLHGTAADADGVVLQVARRRKERTYPELVGARAWLVVLAMEVGGRWSGETTSFVTQLARAKVRHETAILQKRTEQAWCVRWGAMLSCGVAKAVATSLLGLRCAHGFDGDTPSTWDVEGEHRHAGLAP